MNGMRTIILLCLTLVAGMPSISQSIHGTVFNEQGDLLPFASILIKGTSQGVNANSEGRFSLRVKPGTYTVVCQHVGYERQERTLSVKEDEEIIFILALQRYELREVIVKAGDEDPAYEIIRNAIRKRPFYNSQVNAFTCEAYIKGLVKLRNLPSRILGQKVPEEDIKQMRLDSSGKGIIFLSESVTEVARQDGKMKLHVVSGRQSGSNGFGFNFPTFINLYENNVSVFTSRFNPRGFVSPIADNALQYYRYKFLGSFFEDGKEINSIRVTPRRPYQPAFSGIINITEGEWRIHSCDLLLTKTAQLELLDTLRLTQLHLAVDAEVWRVKNQHIHFNFRQLGIDAIGDFVNVYSKYDLHPSFPKKYFDNVIIRYDTSVIKSREYWDSTRPIPLEPEEIKDYDVKDSIQHYEDSLRALRNIDSLKKLQGPLKLKQILWNGVDRTHYGAKENSQWQMDPLARSISYNTVEGLVVEINGGISKPVKKWKTNVLLAPHLRYGFSNRMGEAWLALRFRAIENMGEKYKRESWYFAGGTRISQFNPESNLTPLANSISTLLYGRNFMKIYRNSFGEARYSRRFESGLRFMLEASYENREPLKNSSQFIFVNKNKSRLTPNYPYRIIPAQFIQHQAFIISTSLSYKPGQRYIQFPKNKIAIGSKYPLFTFDLQHGINKLAGSDVDFDKWKFSISDNVNMKLAGAIRYSISAGGFLSHKKVFVQDLIFFNGNESKVAKEYMNTFQLLPYYSAFTSAGSYASLHFEYHLNGLFTNRVPLFRKLGWTLLAGSNAFYAGRANNYAEAFAGLENIFKLFRFDVVGAARNGGRITWDYRLGLGGSIGGGVSRRVARVVD